MAKCPDEILDNMDQNVKFVWHNTVNHYISINILVHNVEKVGSSVPLGTIPISRQEKDWVGGLVGGLV